jgi:hypothetical protein
MVLTELRPWVNGDIFQDWLWAKVVQGYKCSAAHALVRRARTFRTFFIMRKK